MGIPIFLMSDIQLTTSKDCNLVLSQSKHGLALRGSSFDEAQDGA
jgi:hypothetical protein